MPFTAQPYVERAKALLREDDPYKLVYAALELRLAIERICYRKLRMRLEYLDQSALRRWQPRQVVETVVELADPHAAEDYSLFITSGRVRETHLGSTKAINPKKLGKHWQKLSSYLHLQIPKEISDIIASFPSESVLKPYLEEVIGDLEEITSATMDIHMALGVQFVCIRCAKTAVRSEHALTEKKVVVCSGCGMRYITHRTAEGFSFEPYRTGFRCVDCGRKTYFDADVLFTTEPGKLASVKCEHCGKKYEAYWGPTVRPALPAA
jgi:DNA-directed RNA polymerase subunit RPC12/RpoP